MDINTCRNLESKSAINFISQCQNIHIMRGMTKDFGFCGLKIGIIISSNKKIK